MDNEKLDGTANQQPTDNSNSGIDDKQLIQKIPIQHTPFEAIKLITDKGETWFVTLGKYRLTENLHTFDHCVREAKNMDWFKIMSIIQIMIEQYDETTHKPTREERERFLAKVKQNDKP